MEVFYILFERCHTKNRKGSLKQHLKYFIAYLGPILQACALPSLEHNSKVDGETVHPVRPYGAELEGRVKVDILRGESVQVERLQSTNVGDGLRYREAIGILRGWKVAFFA